jgi:hypothetical protein
VSRIHTPFIGGATGPEVDRRSRRQLAEPFVPGQPATPAAEPAPPAVASDAEPAELAEATDYAGSSAGADLDLDLEAAEVWTEPAQEAEAPQAEAADEFFPDFLAGPDAPGRGGGGAAEELQLEMGGPSWPGESPERLAEQAHQLLRGALGPWIRSLTTDLGVYAAEIAIPRAFAAGYLAARAEDSGDE